MKLIRCIEYGEFFLKVTTRKITSQEEGFLSFLGTLININEECTYMIS